MSPELEEEISIVSPELEFKNGAPRAGLSLETATERRGAPVRDAVSTLTRGFTKTKIQEVFDEIFRQPYYGTTRALRNYSFPMRAAWNLVSIWLIAKSSNKLSEQLGIYEAESWFYGGPERQKAIMASQLKREALLKSQKILGGIRFDSEFIELLPYILEEHGVGSRSSVMKNSSTSIARAAKKERGIFYTPVDVADFMVEHTCKIFAGNFITAKTLDPACGTAVFLLAMLRAATRQVSSDFSKFNYITTCLHGIDSSAHALDASAFLLLNECLAEIQEIGLSPLAAWNKIRRNLVEADSLDVDEDSNGYNNIPLELFTPPPPSLKELFPKISTGFDILVGNPPYAALGERHDYDSLAVRFASLQGVKPSSRVNLFPLFVEMMWNFTKPGCNAAALVTPLSIAFNGGRQFRNCRGAISHNGGRWQLSFFDREPHALFGEEVKTRNAILFRAENSETPSRRQVAFIETGPMLKWTSRTRARLFNCIDFTEIGQFDISTGIPKLSGKWQAETFFKLQRRTERLSDFTLRITTCAPDKALSGKNCARVFVGGTAYSFLNVYRPTSRLPDEYNNPLSNSPVRCLEFITESDAKVAFAILSSRLVFWIWQVLGDGFHVPSWLFKTIPFGKNSFDKKEYEFLVHIGDTLWLKLQSYRFVSLNGGKYTVGFRPLACSEELNIIDNILFNAAQLDSQPSVELRRFVQNNTFIDLINERCDHVSQLFMESLVK